MRSIAIQATGYALASAAAFGADVALLVLLVERFGWHYLMAATTSFLAGVSVAYVIVVNFVFEYRRVTNRGTEFSLFAIVGLAGLAINLGTMFVLVEYTASPYVVAKIAASGLTFVTNFAVRRWLLFTRWTHFPDAGNSISAQKHD